MNAVLLAADGVNVAQNIGFGIIAAGMIFAALCVVSTKNVVHAALWLVVVLGGVAAQYVLAAAEFVAVSQVMVYIGAVMVLFLFGIMLTRAKIGEESGLNNKGWAIGIPVAVVLFGLLAWAVLDTYGDDTIAEPQLTGANNESTVDIADRVLSPYLAPFFGMTFVLLAAAIGAIVLARKD
ncbi:NADH-quinone oxidoreductase subunit J family protein [Ilumatobacter nonamiensis]|uniref:NADH-quinone oxidoreductase subunit J family protein n=1 Tax=Ilumatobacter nonamiensis TaxID=467093 RepID=UPI0003452CC8|nr:NADH-quinone oxidoreductase subunit J [Ilumatobacter nonamiensis]